MFRWKIIISDKNLNKEWIEMGLLKQSFWIRNLAMVKQQLAKLLAPSVCRLNPVIGKIIEHCYWQQYLKVK